MAAKDRCPSCHQKVSPGDFLCPNCELILDPSLAPARPSGEEVSVVRRLLEIPQRGLPTAKPSTPPRPGGAKKQTGAEGPTRIASLPPERPGVPIVVASLDRVTRELTEFDAWVVSLIDGASDTPALAKKAGLRELELRVVLETLHDRMVVDFADEPLPDEPLFEAELAAPDVEDDEPFAADDEPGPGQVVRGTPTLEIPGGSLQLLSTPTQEVPRAPAGRGAAHGPKPDAFGEALAEVTGAHAAFVPGRPLDDEPAAGPPPPRAPSGQRGAVDRSAGHAAGREADARPAQGSPGGRGTQPAPGPVAPPSRASAPAEPARGTPTRADARPAVPGPLTTPSRATPAAPLAYPADRPGAVRVTGAIQPAPPSEAPRSLPPSFSPTPASGTSAAPRGPERTDPRIAYTGPANRKVLDALKKVKRRDEHAPAAPAPATAPPKAPAPAAEAPRRSSAEAERQAASALQIALRMEQGGRLEEAVRYLEKSISQSPDAPSLYNRLAIILMRERADLKRAETLLQKAVDLDPDNEVFAKNLKHVVSQRALRAKR
jgi:hypothetical protein